MGSPTARESTVTIGDVVEARYQIEKLLGQGATGSVFQAVRTSDGRRIALKVFQHELASDAAAIERYFADAKRATSLAHDNLVEATDFGLTADHLPYVAFELLSGVLLTDEIYRLGGLPVRRAAWIASQLAEAIGVLHGEGVVHRVLDSDSVFLIDRERTLDHVKLLDAGMGQLIASHRAAVSTAAFLAPEQLRGEPGDERSDVYALGVVIYEMLTARRPFGSDDDVQALAERVAHEPPPPLQRPDVPEALSQLILGKLLAKDPSQRYSRLSDVQAALSPFTARRRNESAMGRKEDETNDQDVARHSGLIPKPANVRETPWPAPDTVDAQMQVALPQAMPPRRPYGLYAVATAGIALGGVGVVVGMRSSADEKPMTAATAMSETSHAGAAIPATRETPTDRIQIDIDADAPNSHVVFRRRVQQAPSTLQVSPTDVVELVEVSAPGYKTERYWLTFDRPTHLKAHLVKGTGSAEASEEETLVALGELQAPTGQAVAAAAPAPTMPATAAVASAVAPAPTPAAAPKATTVATVDKSASSSVGVKKPAAPERPAITQPTVTPPTTQVAVAPRKIGRGQETGTHSEASAQPALAVEAPLPMPELPQVAKEDKPEPRPAAASSNDSNSEQPKPMPVAEPAVAKGATIDNGTVSSVVGSHRPEVLKCFAEGKKKDHNMKGTISLQLQVDATGSVKRVQVQSTLNAPVVAGCIVKSANGWKFPARSGADMATVAYPFTIN